MYGGQSGRRNAVGGKGRTLFLSRRRAAVIFVVVGTVRSAPSRNARRTASARTSVLFRDGQNIRVENPPCAASAASETATTSCGATSALVNASRDRRVGVGHVTRKPGLVSVPKEVSTPAEVSQIVDASWGGILSTVTSFPFFVTPSPSLANIKSPAATNSVSGTGRKFVTNNLIR